MSNGSIREQRLCSHKVRSEQINDAYRDEEEKRSKKKTEEEQNGRKKKSICGYILGE